MVDRNIIPNGDLWGIFLQLLKFMIFLIHNLATMIVGKLVLRSSAGRHGPKGNFTVLYDGEGELRFGLVRYHIYHNGKGKGLLSQSYKYNLVYHLIVQFYSKWLLVNNSIDVNSEIFARILFS